MQRAIDIAACFREAWRGFKGWWIPLCVLSAFIFIANQPRLVQWLVRDEARIVQPYVDAYSSFRHTLAIDPLHASEAFDRFIDTLVTHSADPETQAGVQLLIKKVLLVVVLLIVILCLPQVASVIISKASVQRRREDRTLKRDFKHSLPITLSYLFLTAVKMSPFFLIVLPLPLLYADVSPFIPVAIALLLTPFCVLGGAYLYVRLFFCSFIITEGSANPFAAMCSSWRMTSDHVPGVFVIFLSMLALDIIAVPTIIGAIPANSFNYTLRAAAYRQVKTLMEDSHG